MTPTQTVQLVTIITQLWPSMKLNEYTPDAWHLVLEDLDHDDARAAVAVLARTKSGYITPHDIRHQCARAAGLLPPEEGAALQMAVTVAGNLGTGASLLPGPVRAAYWDMGGSSGFQGAPSVLRAQWRTVYGDAVEAYERDLLGGDLGTAIAHTKHAQITAAPTAPETPALSVRPVADLIEGAFRHVPSDRE